MKLSMLFKKEILRNLVAFSGGLLASIFLIFLTDRLLGLKFTNSTVLKRETDSVILRRYKNNQVKFITVQKFFRENFIAPNKEGYEKPFRFRVGEKSDLLCEPGNNLNSSDSNNLKTIFFVGGSTTENTAVKEENRFHCSLNRRFKENGLNLIAKNYGVSGNHSMHSNIILLTKLAPLKPDYIVLMHNINDISILLKGGNYWNDSTSSGIFTSSYGKLEGKYQFAKEIKDLLIPNIWIILKNNFEFTVEPKVIKTSDPNTNFKNVALNYRKSLNSFIAISKAMEITPIIMTQPSGFQSDSKEFLNWWKKRNYPAFKSFESQEESFKVVGNFHKEFNNIIRDIASRQNILLIDLDENINPKMPIFTDVVHFNEAGNNIMSDIIHDFFATQL